METKNLAQISANLYELLDGLSQDERQRVIGATLTLFGDQTPTKSTETKPNAQSYLNDSENDHTPKSYMDYKDPQNKGETLAVAARYRELYQNEESHARDDIKEIFTSARRNFDAKNYNRDMKNNRNQAGYFNKNSAKGVDTLSYYGQNYVDALPDREKAKKINKPKIKSSSKKKSISKKVIK